MPGHTSYPYVQARHCVICRDQPCDARTGTTFGIHIWLVDEVIPPDPGEDIWPWLHGPIRQGWWDRVYTVRGVA